MKARVRYWEGKWWCRRMGVTGCGNTIEEAWDDMWALYAETVKQPIIMWPVKPRE